MLNTRSKRILLGGYVSDQFSEDALKFRLTYEGPLRSTPKDARGGQPVPNADFKHGMRQHFHRQLKHLWASHPALRAWKAESDAGQREWRKGLLNDVSTGKVDPNNPEMFEDGASETPKSAMSSILADQFSRNGYNFVPLVWEDIDLICSIDVLFLRRGRPGNLFSEGDVDNRMKTLIDTLRFPRSLNELGMHIVPEASEVPFYCLLEDDKFLSHFSVETDELHDPLDDAHNDASKVRLIIDVELKPWTVSFLNLHFA